jgi:hypothetical protein
MKIECKLEISNCFDKEAAYVKFIDVDGNTVDYVNVKGVKIVDVWKVVRKDTSVTYKQFCEAAKLSRAKYNRELSERSRENAHRYASYWKGTKGKSYNHYRSEYGC